mmetsp:Transcript_35235/g.80515  ORF Transcript_35235/g.80515 Transcript_35235/m.80515 type:complete len:107 (-) Transcript_35235:983-1303(-)
MFSSSNVTDDPSQATPLLLMHKLLKNLAKSSWEIMPSSVTLDARRDDMQTSVYWCEMEIVDLDGVLVSEGEVLVVGTDIVGPVVEAGCTGESVGGSKVGTEVGVSD